MTLRAIPTPPAKSAAEPLGANGLETLRKERQGRRKAEARVRELTNEVHALRDKAELWEYRAKRYSDQRNAAREELNTLKGETHE